MNEEKTKTQELSAVIEPSPTPQEGEIMPDTPENLTIRVNTLEASHRAMRETYDAKFQTVDARLAGFLDPEQLEEKIQSAVKAEIEPLTSAQRERMAELRKQTEAHRTETEARDKQVNLLTQHIDLLTQQSEMMQKALLMLLGTDVTNPAAAKTGDSVFERMAETRRIADSASERVHDAEVKVLDQGRHVDNILNQINIKFEKFDKIAQTLDDIETERAAERQRKERAELLKQKAWGAVLKIATDPKFLIGLGSSGGLSIGALIAKLAGLF